MKLFQFIFMFALFAASAFAYEVAIKVTVSQDTLAVGTNATIVKDGVQLYSAKAGMDGMAVFQLDQGSYLLILDRGGYPRHVSLLEVAGPTNVTRTMSQGISYASAYGQVTGPDDFSGASIGAFSGGNIVKRISPNFGGHYVLSFLPEGEYELVFTAPGFGEKRSLVSLRTAEFAELNVRLDKTVAAPVAPPAIKAPSRVSAKTVIEVLITDNGVALEGATVRVQTPEGSFDAVTGKDGIARVNAVQPGEYRFAYGDLGATTIVPNDAVQPPEQQPPAWEPEPQAPAQQPQGQQQGNGLLAGLAVIGIAGAIVIIGIAVFVMSAMKRKNAEAPRAPEAGAREGAEPAEKAHRKGMPASDARRRHKK